MKLLAAVKRYMEAPPNERKCDLSELKEFKAACSLEESRAFAAELRTYGYDVDEPE